MKKKHLIFAFAMSTQILFTGCASLNNLSQSTPKPSTTPAEAVKAITTPAPSASTTGNISQSSTPTVSPTPKGTNNDQTAAATSNSTISLTTLSKIDLQKYSIMTKTGLIKTFGDKYKEDGTTLTFSNGLSFYGLAKEESKPTLIKCTNNISIMGIKNGMTFTEVEAILGKANIITTYINDPTDKAYKLQYTFGKDIFKVLSRDKTGKDSYIVICPLD